MRLISDVVPDTKIASAQTVSARYVCDWDLGIQGFQGPWFQNHVVDGFHDWIILSMDLRTLLTTVDKSACGPNTIFQTTIWLVLIPSTLYPLLVLSTLCPVPSTMAGRPNKQTGGGPLWWLTTFQKRWLPNKPPLPIPDSCSLLSEEKLSLVAGQYFTNRIIVQIGESLHWVLIRELSCQHLAGTSNTIMIAEFIRCASHDDCCGDGDGDDGYGDDSVWMTLMKKADILATEGKVWVKQIELKWAQTCWAASTPQWTAYTYAIHCKYAALFTSSEQCAVHRCMTYRE